MTPTRWIVFGAICLLTLGGLVALSRDKKVDVSSVDVNIVNTTGPNADHVFGKVDSKVVLVEYGDFQCPSCGGAYPQLKTLKSEYKDRIAFVFRHFPLTTIHPNAFAASSAAEAASKQGKFWEMHDKLYETQSTWENISPEKRGDVFISFAQELGLNVDTFKNDLSSESVSAKINYDRALGGKAGVNATPTLFLNGKKLSNDIVGQVVQGNGDKLKNEIETALKDTSN